MKKQLPPILSPAKVAEVSRATLGFLRRNLGDDLPLSLAQVRETVGFLPVAKRCAAVRERKGLTVSDVARQLKVPQYRLKAIESSFVAQVNLDVLHAYIKFLGLSGWYNRWTRSNTSASRPGRVARRREKGGAV